MDKAVISQIPLFGGLPEKQTSEIGRIAIVRPFKKGETIFSEGDRADGFYINLKGRIKIFKLSSEGKEQILHIIEPGEPFGEAAVFTGTRFPAHAESISETDVLFIPRTAFVELITKDPSLSLNMLAILSKRLKQFTVLVEHLSLKEVPQRLAAFLLYLSKGTDDRNEITLTVTKGQLASMLGTIPETLSRILNKMVAQELLRVQGKSITIIDRDALEGLAIREKSLL